MYLKDVITAAAEAAKIPIAEVKQIKLSLPPHDFPGGTSVSIQCFSAVLKL